MMQHRSRLRAALFGGLVTFCSASIQAEETNPFRNPGFEETAEQDGRLLPVEWTNRFETRAWWGEVLPPGWSNSEDRMRNVEVDRAAARSGDYGLKLKTSGGPRLFVQQPLAITGKYRWWKMTAWARAEKGGMAWAQLRLHTRGLRATSAEVLLTAEWQELAMWFRTPGPRAVVQLIGWVPSSDIHFDDVQVEPAQEPELDISRRPKRKDEPSAREIFMSRPSPTAPGEVYVESPTHHCLGLEWPIHGDYNRNGKVDVRYRKSGEKGWKEAMPMFRLMWEEIAVNSLLFSHVCPNMYAGSIVDLEPGAEYEVQLNLTDPDGGDAQKTLTLATRPWPEPYTGGRKLHVYPPGPGGKKQEPAFEGLKAAYAEARPGDIVLVHRGVYFPSHEQLDNGRAYILDKKGTPEKPIVIRGAGDGPAVFNGRYTYTPREGEGLAGVLAGYPTIMFDMRGADHHHLENLVFRNAEKVIFVSHCTGLVVRGCLIEPRMGYGIVMGNRGCRDFTITDSVFNYDLFEYWNRRDEWLSNRGGYGKLWRPYSMSIAGQGHAICHNLIRGFFDGLNLSTYPTPPEDPTLRTSSIDVYHNIVSGCADDGMETDTGVHNVRIYRNLWKQCFMGISFQPLNGGPGYVFRNVMYDIDERPFKLHNWPAGILALNNTIIFPRTFGFTPLCRNSRFINNLFLGTQPASRGAPLTGTEALPSALVFDYNGYRNNAGEELTWMFRNQGEIGLRKVTTFKSVEELCQATGHERNGRFDLDYDAFVKCSPDPETGLLEYGRGLVPTPGRKEHSAGRDLALPRAFPPSLDLRLREGSKAIDAGTVIPNITDRFAGAAPDLGACELGDSFPDYGPRPEFEPRYSHRKRR